MKRILLTTFFIFSCFYAQARHIPVSSSAPETHIGHFCENCQNSHPEKTLYLVEVQQGYILFLADKSCQSLYPLGYVDGMSLYNGYFAQGFGLDPSGTRIIWDVKEDTLENIWNQWGLYGITLTGRDIVQFKGNDIIKEWQNSNGCWCAKVIKAKRGDIRIYSRIPNTAFIGDKRIAVDEGYEEKVTSKGITITTVYNPLKDMAEHEDARIIVNLLGYFEYIKPSSESREIPTKCGTICRKEQGKAKRILQDYLISLRWSAKKHYQVYSDYEQAQIDKENLNLVRNWDGHIMGIRTSKIHPLSKPPAFAPPPCNPYGE